TSWRPNTAPGNMQQPPRLQPLRNSATVVSLIKTSSSNQKCHVLGYDQQFATGQERTGLRLLNSVEYVTGVSPYQLPAINNYVMPVPPPRLQNRGPNAEGKGVPRGRRFHLPTAPSDPEQLPAKTAGGIPRSSPRSNALVTMIFLGKSVRLSHDDADYRDEIKVYQQHCGGENLCVYKGRLLEGETFQFVSKRHHGFPFSLTFFLNGIQVDRLSCCCEYKHQKCSRLGGRHGFFAFLHVEGASPCYRCIIAMGLDKKPSPPKRKVKEDQYDEDFEADEEVNEEGQTDDQMNGMSKSSSDDKKHNLEYENESKTSSQEVLQASDSEEGGSDGYSDSDSEDDEQ
ncbi:PREDICTED: glutamate-rich protein 3, partial [Nestor notabilis]|uniref:glutamate-rich protein 3 n=1 Tax=Nestor notabilis TaxID=176057 RepID=UPI0005231ECD